MSLLINLGCDSREVAERIGDTVQIVEKTYYTNQSIKGIGSQSDTQDIITIEDSKGVTEKTTENIENLEEFVNWIDNK